MLSRCGFGSLLFTAAMLLSLTGAQAQNQAQMIMDRNDLHRDWGPSAYNIPNQGSISGSYELPFGKNKLFGSDWNNLTNQVLGGWQISSVPTAEITWERGSRTGPTHGRLLNYLPYCEVPGVLSCER